MSKSARTRHFNNGIKNRPFYPAIGVDQSKNALFSETVFSAAGCRVHMIGIGGCGMCGAAAVLLRGGAVVSGSDRSESAVLKRLADQGATIHIGQSADNVPADCDLVVCSAAIKESNPELQAARRHGLRVIKYSELLGLLMSQRSGIAVAGTHGKSTTTAMITYVLRTAGLDPSFVIGADVEQLGSGSGVGDGEHFVVEACEYARSYLDLRPRFATILNVDEDHLDYYKNLNEIIESFRSFASMVPHDGLLVVNGEDDKALETVTGLNVNFETFGLDGEVDWEAEILDTEYGCSRFRVLYRGQTLTEIKLSIPGKHNVANALAAMAICYHCGVEPETSAQALGAFRGAQRRLTFYGRVDGVSIVDDYAHHPTEIKATLRAARDFYKPGKMYVVFQPHQHSRTRFLLNDFAKSFGVADEVIVPDIYFVRDSETERDLVDAKDLVERIHGRGSDARYEPEFTNIVSQLCREVQPGDLVLTMGAGNVWQVAVELLKCLSRARGKEETLLASSGDVAV